MANINEMKKFIMDAYPNNPKFREKVATKMPTNQVVAIYNSVKARIERQEMKKPELDMFHQMDIWEYMVEKNAQENGPGTHTQIQV